MGAWILDLLTLARCLLAGHDGETERNGSRIYLRCRRCRRVSPGWVLALLALIASPAYAADTVEPLRVTVRPAIGFAPGDIHALVFIERDARNRSLTIIDGAQRQRVWERWWLGHGRRRSLPAGERTLRRLPCGDYEVRAELRRVDGGKARILKAKARAELRGHDCPALAEAGQ